MATYGRGSSGTGSWWGTPQQPRPGTPGAPAIPSGNATRPSWEGGTAPNTFEPKDFGTTMFNDLSKIYARGPNPFNRPLFTEYGAETKGLIGNALADINATRNGVVGEAAGGGWLQGGNPYFEDMLARTRDNVSTEVNDTFSNLGLWGSTKHGESLSEGLGRAELDARGANFENEWQRMLGSQGWLRNDIGTGIDVAGLLDSKERERLMAEYDLHNRQTGAPFEHIAKNVGLLTGNPANVDASTNQPLSLWDIIGGIGGFLGDIL